MIYGCAKCINIRIRAYLPLRCHLLERRIASLLHLIRIVLAIDLCRPEIDQLHLTIRRDHDIVRTDVPVHHLLPVHTTQCADHRTHDRQRLRNT